MFTVSDIAVFLAVITPEFHDLLLHSLFVSTYFDNLFGTSSGRCVGTFTQGSLLSEHNENVTRFLLEVFCTAGFVAFTMVQLEYVRPREIRGLLVSFSGNKCHTSRQEIHLFLGGMPGSEAQMIGG
jgi:hypothetical protein